MIGVEMSLDSCKEDFKTLNFRFRTSRKGGKIGYYSVEEEQNDDGFVIVTERKPESKPLFNLTDLFEI